MKIYEFSTWQGSPEWKAKEEVAINAAKAYKGGKWVVNIGEWGTRTFLIFAETKDEAKMVARNFIGDNTAKATARNVTNAKKYN